MSTADEADGRHGDGQPSSLRWCSLRRRPGHPWRAPRGEDSGHAPADAAPEKVVQTLIAAINARDADAVRAVSTPSFADQVIDTWFGVTFEDVSIDAPPDVAGADTGVYVHIDAVLHGTDGSLPNGELVGWGYSLTRQDGGSRWLVSDQGVG